MQTKIHADLIHSETVQSANAILRNCVHCGFCLATCPTYKLSGNELDSPRGRIYLIKEMLEHAAFPISTVTHLDRCLTCRACETTCPSGVDYASLLETGRGLVETHARRSMVKRLQRWILKKTVPRTSLFSALLKMGRACKSFLPGSLAMLIPRKKAVPSWPTVSHERKMLVLQGCVQSAATPEVNAVLANLLDQLGISLIYTKQAGCCGALEHHLADEEASHARIRNLVDAWWPEVEAGIEHILVTASGCGVMVKDFGRLLKSDPQYSEKAARISALARDAAELLDIELRDWKLVESDHRVAWHSPCTLQHGQKIVGTVESLLLRSGAQLTSVAEEQLCCGSAGTYSLLEPEFSENLLERKINSLTADCPQVILTANVGCQLHLAKATRIPVRHWLEYLSEQYMSSL